MLPMLALATTCHLRGPAEAGPFRSILVVVLVRDECEVHEPVHFGAIGKKPDDITSIVYPVDYSTCHGECWCLRRTGGIELKESPVNEDEPVCIASLIGEGRSRSCLVAASGGLVVAYADRPGSR